MRFRVARFKYWPLLLAILLIISLAQSYVLINREETFCPEFLSPEEETWNAVLENNNELRMKVLEKEAIIAVLQTNEEECWKEEKNCGIELPHPKLRLNSSHLQLEKNYVRFDITGVEIGIVGNTNSMDPVLDEDNLVLEIMPDNPGEVQVGDIVIYELNGERIIHRVIEVGADKDAWYIIAKGDNNAVPDPEKIRWSQIRGVVVGIIY